MNLTAIYSAHFSRKEVKALRAKGITIIGAQHMPDEHGSFAPGILGYWLDDNGTHRIRTYLEVAKIAKGEEALIEA